MPLVTARRARRLTPLPWLAPLYLPGAAVSAVLLVTTVLNGTRDLPGMLAMLAVFGACYLGLHQGIYLSGDRIALQHPLRRTVIPLAQVKEFTIRPDERRPFRRLWIELDDGTQIPTNVASGRSLLAPPIRPRFERLVALVERLDSARRETVG